MAIVDNSFFVLCYIELKNNFPGEKVVAIPYMITTTKVTNIVLETYMVLLSVKRMTVFPILESFIHCCEL